MRREEFLYPHFRKIVGIEHENYAIHRNSSLNLTFLLGFFLDSGYRMSIVSP